MKTDRDQALFRLGALTGQHRAFSLVANRCSAADAEALKTIRDEELYKDLGYTWDEFCVKYAGISRSYGDQHIRCFEEYGDAYRHMAEIMSMTPPTFKLIAGSISDKGLAYQGEYIPIEPENRVRLAVAVKGLRQQQRATKSAPAVTPGSLDKHFDKLVTDVNTIVNLPERHAAVVTFLERAHGQLDAMLRIIRRTPVSVK